MSRYVLLGRGGTSRMTPGPCARCIVFRERHVWNSSERSLSVNKIVRRKTPFSNLEIKLTSVAHPKLASGRDQDIIFCPSSARLLLSHRAELTYSRDSTIVPSALIFKLGYSNTLPSQMFSRQLHTSVSVLDIERSKVEKAVNVIKSEKESLGPTAKLSDTSATTKSATDVKQEALVVEKPVPKKTIPQRIWAEVLHYYHGFRLLCLEVTIACRYLWKVSYRGETLTRRERRQLVRTTADMFRLVPFSVFIIVPFMELLLPVALMLFPNMLPSTFKEADKEMEKQRKRLKMKLEMAKFLQDTIEDSAVKKRKGAKGESVQGFVRFMEKIRSSGGFVTNEEILKYAQVFEDEITLDNLNYLQLRALCKLLEIPIVGVSETVLRFQLELRLRRLEADDRLIMTEGIDSLAMWELQEACRARGMRSLGVTEERLKSQLSQWLDLHLHHRLPQSLLLLSRAFYLPDTLDTASQMKATLSKLEPSAEAEVRVKISEVTGDRVDTKSKLEVLKQEEAIIKAERAEVQREQKRAQQEEAQRVKGSAKQAAKETVVDTAHIIDSPPPAVPDDVTKLADSEKDEISAEDLERVEELLVNVGDRRRKLKVEAEDLDMLKEDVNRYKGQVEDLKEVLQSSGSQVFEEPIAVRILNNRVNKMIRNLDGLVEKLSQEKAELMESIVDREDLAKEGQQSDSKLKEILVQIDKDRHNVIGINELMKAMRQIQTLADETKMKKIIKVLDEDEDGVIGISEALRVIEMLGMENTLLASKQVTHIVDLLRKEQKMLQERKLRKQQKKHPIDGANAVGNGAVDSAPAALSGPNEAQPAKESNAAQGEATASQSTPPLSAAASTPPTPPASELPLPPPVNSITPTSNEIQQGKQV